MGAALFAQYVVIALAVLASVAFVAQSRWPAGVRRARIACAVPLVRETRPAWLRKVGRWIAPPARGGAGGCDDGCDGCSSH